MVSTLLSILLFSNYVHCIEKLRGVSPDDIQRYQPGENGTWHCLSDPSIVISYDKVNDNYCDCPDGSDEPGTSACGNGRFYCANVGFKSTFIPSYKVDDGVCDYDVCCDGSDEPEGLCENRCDELNSKFEHDVMIHNDVILRGLQLKKHILDESLQIRQELEESVTSLESQICSVKEQIEALEKEQQKLDKNQQVIIDHFNVINQDLEDSNILLHSQFTELSNYITKLESLEQILKQMTEEYNHNFNDPAVKKAASDYLNFAASFDGGDSKKTDISSVVSNFKASIEKVKTDMELSKNEIIALKSNAPQSHRNEKHGFIDDVMQVLASVSKQLVESFLGVKSHLVKYEYDTRSEPVMVSPLAVTNQLNDLNAELNALTNKLQSSQSELAKDYGENDILRSLTDCIITPIGEYSYKLCFHSSLEQIKDDSRGTKIGVFEHIEFSETTKNYKIRFNRGERCWNGPVREAIVDIVCGLETKILQVTEPEKCTYNIKLASPIGCFESDLIQL